MNKSDEEILKIVASALGNDLLKFFLSLIFLRPNARLFLIEEKESFYGIVRTLMI